ncbi:Ig-like domain-containing protein [Aquimarina gracilis]|uniref:Ig-like domain-containing protein n=1 Tax=Aquimarina gracilis TaxID=874422 RepID=A0ABU5ZWB3_9FLAO|nr:Ig-like domain-containing protein [Aquimarina gracilis]MEB3346166.1 Ig-like domain-containing protein [Aquimarina gracilis]
MKLLKKISILILLQVCFFSCTNENFLEDPLEIENSTAFSQANKTSLIQPIILGYFPSWSESWTTTGQGSKLRDIPKHVTHVFLAFARPNLRYQKGSLDITNTGIQTPYGGATLKESVSVLKSKGIKVILSVGGETYWGSNAAYDINYQQIKDLVDDMGFEGIDWDFEPNGSFATIGEPINVQRFIDFFNNSRAIMPKGQYLLACAPAGVGALGGLNNDDPSSPFAYNKRNTVTGESDANLYNATSPNEAISLYGFATTGHMIPVMNAVGNKIDLIAYQGYNTGAASNRKIMYDAYKYYADQYGFSIAAGTHYPNEPWGPYYTYTYQNVAELSGHIRVNNSNNDGIMIWQLLLGDGVSSAYGYLYTASQVLDGVSQSQAIANAENYPESPYTGGGDGGGGGGTDCNSSQWVSTTAYSASQEVVYENKLYRAKWWTQGDVPSSNTGDGKPWEFIKNCGDGGGTGNQAPSVSITSPSNNTTFTEGETISISANASDSDGNVTKVEFYQGNTKLGEDTVSPYQYNWSNVSVGNYNISAVATDNLGATTTSAIVIVNVQSSGGGTGSCSGVASWEPYPKIYNQGDQAIYQGVLYEAQTGPLWVTPGSGEHWWKTIATCN